MIKHGLFSPPSGPISPPLTYDSASADDFVVLNFNQDLAKELAKKTAAQVVPFSTTEKVDGAYLDGDTLYFKGEAIMKASLWES